jgi:hypothetical protein
LPARLDSTDNISRFSDSLAHSCPQESAPPADSVIATPSRGPYCI